MINQNHRPYRPINFSDRPQPIGFEPAIDRLIFGGESSGVPEWIVATIDLRSGSSR
jgi:hypothetical protein